MVNIKEKIEDFCVKEVMNLKFSKGNYIYFILKKKNMNTLNALDKIARRLDISLRRFGFAGLKDKRAITEQYVSVHKIDKKDLEKLNIKDIEIKIVGEGKDKIKLGDLKENEFKIRINKKINKKIDWIVNYFGEQRFGINNCKLGRDILKGNVIKKERRLLMLYVHAVQSYIFNESVRKYLKCKYPKIKPKNVKVPLIGYETSISNEKFKKIIRKIMEKEKLNFSDFRIIGCPELSMKGIERDMVVNVRNFKCKTDGNDSILSFKLSKGSYATVVIDQLLKK